MLPARWDLPHKTTRQLPVFECSQKTYNLLSFDRHLKQIISHPNVLFQQSGVPVLQFKKFYLQKLLFLGLAPAQILCVYILKFKFYLQVFKGKYHSL